VLANGRVSTSEATYHQIRRQGPNDPSAIQPGWSLRVSGAGGARRGGDACPRTLPVTRRRISGSA